MKDRIVLATGASSGIGEGVARELAAGGAKVMLGARRTDRLESLVADIEAAGGTALGHPLDVTDRDDVAGFAQAAVEAWGRVDVIVNNAGIMPLSPLAAMKVDEEAVGVLGDGRERRVVCHTVAPCDAAACSPEAMAAYQIVRPIHSSDSHLKENAFLKHIRHRLLHLAPAVAVLCMTVPVANAEPTMTDDVVRIGFVTDLSGPYEAVDGNAGADAIRMAIDDLGGTIAGKPVELIALDHRNDPERAAALATELFDVHHADVLISGVNTDTSLAMIDVARTHRKPFLVVGAGSSRHTNERCSPYTVQWAYDTTALSKVTANGVVGEGGRDWFFMTADYAFGLELQRDTGATVEAAGGTVVGTVRHPHEETEFAPYVQQARESGADVLALASGHSALVGALRAETRAGDDGELMVAGLLVFIDDVHELGPELAQGLFHADSWFWTRDADTRAWSERFFAQHERMPSSLHAADYSAAYQYLQAVDAVGSDDGDRVLSRLRAIDLDDMYLKNGRIRGDGQLTHDMYLLRVKAPGTNSKPWDYDELVGTFSGDQAWGSQAQSRCTDWISP